LIADERNVEFVAFCNKKFAEVRTKKKNFPNAGGKLEISKSKSSLRPEKT
jgi:hypothetical protein